MFPYDRVSYNILAKMAHSPAEAIYAKHNKKPPTPAMEFGSAVEDLLLNEESQRLVGHPSKAGSKTREFREAKAAALKDNPDVIYLDFDKNNLVEECAETVRQTALFTKYITGEQNTQQVAGVTVEQKVKDKQNVCNIIDVVVNDNVGYPVGIIDLKVVNDPLPHGFRNQCDRMRWDIQAAAYVRMVEKIDDRQVPFFWFVVQSTPPWNVAIYEMDETWLKIATEDYLRWVWEWFDWKNSPPIGDATQINHEPETLVSPPWR